MKVLSNVLTVGSEFKILSNYIVLHNITYQN